MHNFPCKSFSMACYVAGVNHRLFCCWWFLSFIRKNLSLWMTETHTEGCCLSWVTTNCPVLSSHLGNYCWWPGVTRSQPSGSDQWADQEVPGLLTRPERPAGRRRATFPEYWPILLLRDHWSTLTASLSRSMSRVTRGRGLLIVTLSSSSLHHRVSPDHHHCHCHEIIQAWELSSPAPSDLGLLQLTHHFTSLGFTSLFVTIDLISFHISAF